MKYLIKFSFYFLFIASVSAQWSLETLPFNSTSSNNEVLYSDPDFLIVKDGADAPRVSIDQGKTWETKGPFGAQISSAAVLNKLIFVGTSADGIFSSNNNGKNWTKIASYSSVDDIKLCGNILLAATEDGVKKYNVALGKWEDQGLKGVSVDQIFYNPFEKSCYFVTFFDLYMSNDFGVTSKKIQSPSFSRISSMDFQSNLYCWSSSSGVFFSDDKGVTFNRLQNSPGFDPSSVIISGDFIYVSFKTFQSDKSEGVHRYSISGKIWEAFNEGLNHTNIKLMRYNNKDRLFVIHVDGNFVPKLYSRPFQIINNIETYSDFFNISANISDNQIIFSEIVDQLEIYDIHSNLVYSSHTRGNQFDIQFSPGGIYFYKVRYVGEVLKGKILYAPN